MATTSSVSGGDINMEMEIPLSEVKGGPSFRTFTKAERIQQLNEIDKSISQLLRSAGLAIKTLTAYQMSSDSVVEPIEDRTLKFTDATNIYLRVLHSVDVRLKRQVCGLDEAGIIGREKEPVSNSDGQVPDGPRASSDRATLDVGWLNSRTGKVGRDMEAELWANSRVFLEEMITKNTNDRSLVVDDSSKDKDMGG